MARIFIESFETQRKGLWDTENATASIVSTDGLNLNGDYCLSCNNNGYLQLNHTSSELYCSFQLRTKTVNTNTYAIKIDSSTMALYVRYSGGFFDYETYASSVPLGIISIVSNANYFIQLYFKIHNTSGRIYVKINGGVDIDFTGDTQYSSQSAFDRIRFGYNTYHDNIVIDDSVIPEETEISVLKPNGVGHYSDFVPTPAGSNYTCVDEMPYNDSDFVSSGIVNAVDTYTLEDMPNAKSVKCVQMQARARKDSDSPLTKFNFVIRDGITDYQGNDILLSNTFDTYTEMWLDGPTGSGIWCLQAMDLFEIGVRARI